MKWVLYVIAAIVFAGVFVSIVGIVTDAEHLTFWTQTFMLSLLGTVVVAPALVYVAAKSKSRTEKRAAASSTPETSTSPAGTSSSTAPSRPKRSAFRMTAYVFSGLVVVWAAVSLISLFVDQARLSFWTQSVMWSLLVLLIWAPVMAFFINPFNESTLQDAPSEETRRDESARDFVPEQSTTLASGAAATEDPDTRTSDTHTSRSTPSSAMHDEPDTGRNRPEGAGP